MFLNLFIATAYAARLSQKNIQRQTNQLCIAYANTGYAIAPLRVLKLLKIEQGVQVSDTTKAAVST